jgi:WD40-like Beta Propeller Repeat
MRIKYSLSWFLAALLIVGCVPDRIVWSPDGSRAAVLGDDGLHVCDVAGKLSPVLVPGATCMAWMPDSKRMVVCVEGESKNWSAQVYEVGDRSATAGPVIYERTFKEHEGIRSVRVSPTGDAVALAIASADQKEADQKEGEPLELLVVPTGGLQKICDLGRGAAYPDWTPDGKSLVFIRPSEWTEDRKEATLGVLVRQQVMDASGHLLDSEHLPKREDLAGLLFDAYGRVRVAKDGRIFFSAADVALPATRVDFNTEGTIFSFDPSRQSTLTRVVPKGAMQTVGNAAQYFELSPDGSYLSIPFTDGRVSVLDIVQGEAELVQAESEGKQDNLKLATIPQWRTPTELTFVRPVKDSTAHEVVRYSIPEKTATVISGDWPASVGGWIHPEEGALNKPAPGDK